MGDRQSILALGLLHALPSCRPLPAGTVIDAPSFLSRFPRTGWSAGPADFSESPLPGMALRGPARTERPTTVRRETRRKSLTRMRLDLY